MIVREADLDRDALAIMDGARDFIGRMAYTGTLPRDDTVLTAAVSRILTLDGTRVFVAEHDGAIVGGIGAFYAPHMWNPDVLGAEELFWWTHRDAPQTTALRLIRALRDDMRRNNVGIAVFRALTSSPPGVDKVYRRMGFNPVETAYVGAP